MNNVSTPNLESHSRTALATNSGPLSDLMCFGMPCLSISPARLRQRLEQAETILAIQKKASELLGIPLNRPSIADDE